MRGHRNIPVLYPQIKAPCYNVLRVSKPVAQFYPKHKERDGAINVVSKINKLAFSNCCGQGENSRL